MRLYHFMKQEHGLQAIQKRRLKIARLNELNDPFEWHADTSANPDYCTALEATKNTMSKTRGIICFSGSWTNPTQWSHYADSHRGLCLGFDVINGDVENDLIKKIKYRKKPLKMVNFENMTEPKQFEFVIKIISTKSLDWKYEEEFRLHTPLESPAASAALQFMNFGENIILKEVIVGLYSSLNRNIVNAYLDKLAGSVEIRKAQKCDTNYRIVSDDEWS